VLWFAISLKHRMFADFVNGEEGTVEVGQINKAVFDSCSGC